MKTIFTSIIFTLCICRVSFSVNPDSLQAVRYYNKADTLLMFNRHDSSLFYFEMAAKIFESKGWWRGYISSKNKIAENQSAVFQLEQALQTATEARELAITYFGENSTLAADALNNIGNVHYLTGKHEIALEEFAKALKIIENAPAQEKHLYAAPTNMGIGNVYYGKNQYGEAFRYFNTALENNRLKLGENHPYVANSYLSLGNLYRNKGSYKLAFENYEKALEINRQFFGEGHPDVATVYVGMGDIYSSSGAYELSLQYYNQALLIYNRFLNRNNPKLGDVYLGMAEVYKNQGYYNEALEEYENALALYKATIGEQHQNSIRCILGIGNTYMYQERFLEALDYYNRVMEVNFNLVGEYHANTSAAYNNLGGVYYFAGNFDLALRFFKKALEIDRYLYGEDHPNVANAYYNIARVYGEKGETYLALENVQSAISSSIIDFKESNIFVNPALVNFFDTKDLLWFLRFKGETLEQGFKASANMKGMDIALNSFVLSDSLVEKIRQSYTDRSDQIQLGVLANKIYVSAINANYEIIKLLNPQNVTQISPEADFHEKMREYQNRFFYFSERSKGAVLFASIAESNAKSFGGIPDSTLERERNLKIAITQYTQELAANPDSLMQAYYQEQLFIANRKYEELIERMEKEYPKYYELKYDVSVASLKDVQKTLDDSTMMLSYFLTDDYMYSMYITNRSFDIYKNTRKQDYDKWLKAFRLSILYQSQSTYAHFGRLLYKELLPEPIPQGISQLIVVQDGLMATVPFEALLTADVAETAAYPDFPFLARDYAVSYTYSANLLYKTFEDTKVLRPKAAKDVAAIAPVTFERSQLDNLQSMKLKSYEENKVMASARKSLLVNDLPTLPGTEVEVANITGTYKRRSKTTDVWTHGKARESLVKSGLLSNYQYLHIATHGYVNQEEPEFSGIFLSAKDSTGDDGILFSGEIYNLNLNTELVTLSACETGLGKISRGEGIIGLSRALIYAGSKNIVVSLWKVMDESTMQLMTNFYSGFAGKPVPAAITESLSYSRNLQAAKLQIINEGRFAAPYYWSPFILVGR